MTIHWTEKLEDEICQAISKSSRSLPDVCDKNPQFPTSDTIFQHIHNNKAFSDKYVRAKKLQVCVHGEELLRLADDKSGDTGDEASASVNRSKLQVDTRKWWISKIAPKIFGEGLIKKIPFKIDLSKPINQLSQQLMDKLKEDEITLDEAQGAFDILKKYVELTKIPEFEAQLRNIQDQLNIATLKKGEIHHGKEVDTKSNKTSGIAQKDIKSKKGKANPSK